MNDSTIVFLINDQVRAVNVCYEPDGPSYLFKTFDHILEPGDYVVIPTSTRHGFTVAQVTEVDLDMPMDEQTTYHWIVDKVDVAGYKDTIEQEQAAITTVHSAEKRRKREELRTSLLAGAEEVATLEIAHTSAKAAE